MCTQPMRLCKVGLLLTSIIIGEMQIKVALKSSIFHMQLHRYNWKCTAVRIGICSFHSLNWKINGDIFIKWNIHRWNWTSWYHTLITRRSLMNLIWRERIQINCTHTEEVIMVGKNNLWWWKGNWTGQSLWESGFAPRRDSTLLTSVAMKENCATSTENLGLTGLSVGVLRSIWKVYFLKKAYLSRQLS